MNDFRNQSPWGSPPPGGGGNGGGGFRRGPTPPNLDEILKKLHGADIADFLEQASKAERLSIIRLWDSKLRGDVLVELGEGVLIELLEEIASCNLIEAIQGLQTDEIISLLEKIGWAKKETILIVK